MFTGLLENSLNILLHASGILLSSFISFLVYIRIPSISLLMLKGSLIFTFSVSLGPTNTNT